MEAKADGMAHAFSIQNLLPPSKGMTRVSLSATADARIVVHGMHPLRGETVVPMATPLLPLPPLPTFPKALEGLSSASLHTRCPRPPTCVVNTLREEHFIEDALAHARTCTCRPSYARAHPHA